MNTNLKSFSRRIGKSLSSLQENLIEQVLPNYLVDKNNPINSSNDMQELIIEIGIGMAEHFVNQCQLNPSSHFIGCEPYLNGIANCLKLANDQEITNFSLWPDDADLILSNIAPETISKIYLLFPDPWPKTRQKKRRFAGLNRLELIKNLLISGGYFIFASDIPDYVEEVLNIASKIGLLDNSLKNRTSHDGYIQTKYHSKAIEAGRYVQFLILRKP